MEEEDDNMDDIKEELEQSEKLLLDANKEIERLERRLKYTNKTGKNTFHVLTKENHELEKEHEVNSKDIKEYKSQIEEIEKKLKSQNKEIESLTKENEKLKSSKRDKSPERRYVKRNIRGISDVRKSFGFVLKKKKQQEKKEEKEDKKEDKKEEEENVTPGIDSESKKEEFEQLKKSKTDLEIQFHELQKKMGDLYNDMKAQMNYIGNYRSYINALNEKILSFRQDLGISVIGQQIDFQKASDAKTEKLSKELQAILMKINQITIIASLTKNGTLKKGENILQDIQSKLIEIDSNKNLSFSYLSNRIESIEDQIEILKDLCKTVEKSKNAVMDKRNDIESKIDQIKINFEQFMENYKEDKKKINDAISKKIRKIIRKKSRKILEDINKDMDDKNAEENEVYNRSKKEGEDYDLLHGSTLIGINDFGKNMNLFKSTILFDNQNDVEENNSLKAKILKKNFNEVCYVYDDYDIHDINYEIKAVGLGGYSFFNNCSHGFYMGKEIEIITLEVNNKKAKYDYRNYNVSFDINLKNLQTAKVHLKYKEIKDSESLDPEERENQKLFRQEFYGLNENLAGQMGKYRLILKGTFDIVSFEEEIFMRNESNKREKEYIWGGKIPVGGKRTLVKLSKNEAIWSIKCSTQVASRRGNLQNTTLSVPMGFVGGNNDIIKLDYSSPQTKDIQVDEERRVYEINYRNTNYSEGDFVINGEIRNRCTGEWEVDLSDKIIEDNMFPEDKRDKKQLEKIARQIIEDFDRNNEDNIHKYLDYAKIGKWVYENIKYDLNYSGRTEMTAIDIYNQGVGVCHHMTRLANALLYSLGYKVIYTHGFACKTSTEFDVDSAHAWSLINVEGKWFPFDATWDILSGKLPVTHIFQGFFNNSVSLTGTDGAHFSKKEQETGKLIK